MKFRAIVIGLVLSIFPASLFAHTDDPKDKERSQKMERKMAVDSAVSVSVCVMSGNITVRGWDKNEVQARSADAVQIELRRVEPVTPEKTRKLEVVILNKAETPKPQAAQGKCQAYSDVELNIPRGATVVVQTRDGDIDIAEIASAYVGTQNGDISVEQISHSIEVASIGGSICIKDSSGRMSVTSAGGPVEAVNIRPLESGDAFDVTTVSGDITLEGVTHKQVSTTTVSGNVNLTGPLTNGGRYGFNSFSGDITLAMPADSSFRLSAKVSQEADIITDFPLMIKTEDFIGGFGAAAATPPKPPTKSSVPAAPTPESPTVPPAAPKSGVSPEDPTPKVTPTEKVVVYVKPKVKVAVTTKPSYTMRRIHAVCGTGEAAIAVSSFSGTLRLQHN